MLNSLLKVRGVSYSFKKGSLAFFALAILLPLVVPAKQISVSPLPVSPYIDTEILERTTEVCLECGWEQFYHKGIYNGK